MEHMIKKRKKAYLWTKLEKTIVTLFTPYYLSL